MLILTRKIGEALIIGDDVEVRVLSVHGSTARLGIAAPRNTQVHRQEIYDRIQKEKTDPSSSS